MTLDNSDAILRFLIPLSLMWLCYELKALRELISFKRIVDILQAIGRMVFWVACVKFIASLGELIYPAFSDKIFIISTVGFFVAVSMYIRKRRQRFADRWNKHDLSNGALFEDIGQSLETTTKEIATKLLK